jgi:hypothetical protein
VVGTCLGQTAGPPEFLAPASALPALTKTPCRWRCERQWQGDGIHRRVAGNVLHSLVSSPADRPTSLFSDRQLKSVPNLRDPSKAICFRAREMPQKLCSSLISIRHPRSRGLDAEPRRPINRRAWSMIFESLRSPLDLDFWPATRIRPQHFCDILIEAISAHAARSIRLSGGPDSG